MSAITTDERSALVLIGLQQGILALPALRDPDDIKTRARRLAVAFRASTLPVVRVELLILDQLGAQLRGGDAPGRAAGAPARPLGHDDAGEHGHPRPDEDGCDPGGQSRGPSGRVRWQVRFCR